MSFIEDIARYVKQYAPQYNIKVYSPVIAQAILESASGTSELAKNANNFFGLKYNPNQPKRCPSSQGHYIKVGSEQNPDGSYTSSTMLWQKFPSMEAGVKGYFDFLNYARRYDNLKNITNPKQYLTLIKQDGYATSLQYVDNLMNVISKYGLTKYDDNTKEENNNMSNSSLATYTKISPNKTSPRNHAIDTITIHCTAGNKNNTAKQIAAVFAPTSRQASCNYAVGGDGSIALIVEEKDRSWCTSSGSNDNRAITIEVASNIAGTEVNEAAYNATIKLVADICKRNNIKKLVWSTDKNTRMKHLNGANMTVHRDYANKSCPGPYLYSKMGDIANKVNALLNAGTATKTPSTQSSSTTKPASALPYIIQITADALNIRKGPGTNYAVAGVIRNKGKYTIVEEQSGFGKLKSGAGWISLKYTKKI